MSDIKNKFVVFDDMIIAGRVVFHKELHKDAIGGGWWYYHIDQNKLILYGSSHDFGPVTKEQIQSCELGGSFRNLTNAEIVFDKRDHFEVMSILIDHLGEIEGIRCAKECDFI